MLPHILPLFPVHTSYIEPFVGGGAVFWAKEPSAIEVVNDRNRELINFYEVLQADFQSLNALVQNTLHSREAYKDARIIYESPHLFTRVVRAWALWVNCTQTYLSKVCGSWAFVKNKKNQTATKVDNCKIRFDKDEYSQRLSRVTLESDDAVSIIKRFDSPTAFFYCDPPYINSDQGHYSGYAEKDYEVLLTTLAGVGGKFLLSSYESDLLERYRVAHGWKTKKVERLMSAVNNKRKKVEVLTWNY